LRWFKRGILIFFVLIVLLIGGVVIALRFPAVQTWAAQEVAGTLSKSLGVEVKVGSVDVAFPKNIVLKDYLIRDLQKDTMIYGGELNINIRLFSLMNKKVNVKEITLVRSRVHLATDSLGVLNIAEVFKSKKPKTPDTTTTKFDWGISLSALNLEQTNFDFLDRKNQTHIKVRVGNAEIALNDLGLKSGKMDIASLLLENADVAILTNPNGKPKTDDGKRFHLLPKSFSIAFANVEAKKVNVSIDNITKPDAGKGIDFNHMLINNIALKAGKGSIVEDSVFASITNLSATEKSGFLIKSLVTDAKVSPNGIILKDLDLVTQTSHIKNYLSLTYEGFADFKDFMNKVRITGKFDNTRIALKDIDFFVKKLNKVAHNQIYITGNIDGRINNLKGKDLKIRVGKSVFNGSFSTHGLPKITETSINFRIDKLSTTVEDIRRIYPSLKLPENFNTLGNINFKGNLDGFVTDFVTNGSLTTSVGSAVTNLKFAYNPKTRNASYKGNLALNDFNLGKWFKSEQNLGTITLNATVKGSGLTLPTLNIDIKGKVSSVGLKGYTYKDILVDGKIEEERFKGSLAVHDDNLDFDFNGMANLHGATPEFRFVANVRHADLRALNLVKDSFVLSGNIDADFIGKKIDDIQGSLRLRDAKFTRLGVTAPIKFALIESNVISPTQKRLIIKTDEIVGTMEGNYTFTNLMPTLSDFVKTTLTRSSTINVAHVSSQDFKFDLMVYDPGLLTRIIHPKFNYISNSKIEGSFNSQTNHFIFKASVPEFQFANVRASNTDIDIEVDKQEVYAMLSNDKLYMKDSLLLDTLRLTAVNDHERFKLNLLAADKVKKNTANITAFLTPQDGSALVSIMPSEVILAKQLWTFSPDNSILIAGKKITTANLAFVSSDNRSIKVDSYFKGDSSTCFNAHFDNIAINDFIKPFTAKNSDMSGLINGSVKIEDVFLKPAVLADITIKGFALGQIPIGDIIVNSELDNNKNRLNINANILGASNDIQARGYYSLEELKPDMQIDAFINNLSLNFLNYPFFARFVKTVAGNAAGKVTLGGTLQKPTLTGSLTIKEADLFVSYLNTHYAIKNEEVTLTENTIELGTIQLTDIGGGLGETATGTGRIYHRNLKRFGIDVTVVADNLQMLNTTVKLNPIFYGTVFAKGTVKFNGQFNNMVIRANARTLSGTHVALPINSSKETNRYGFYQFVTKGADSLKTSKKTNLKLNGLTFILEADITPESQVDIILNPASGDIIRASGRGNIKLEIPKTGNITMYGNYEIERGDYLFTLQNIVNKPFSINRGGNITFSGDIYQAQLNIDAIYNVRTAPYDLISDLFEKTSAGTALSDAETRSKTRIPVELMMKLRGVLKQPSVSFDLRLIDPDPSIRTYVDNRLQIVRSNETELNKQVFGLLMLNRFLPAGNTINNSIQGGNAIGGGVANTLGEFISSQLSLYLNNFVGSFVQGLDVNFRYRQYDQQSGTGTTSTGTGTTADAYDTRRELQVLLTQRFFKDRLSISAGGNVDFGNTTTAATNGTNTTQRNTTANFAGDFQLEYSLTKDGRWRTKVFNRTFYDNFSARNQNRTGVGISYRQDFDKFGDLFKSPQERKEKKQQKKIDAVPIKDTDVIVAPKNPADTLKPAIQ
jgi:hypothetical protein